MRPLRARRAVDPDWRPSDEVAAGIKSEHPTLDIAAEHKVFIDYWRGTGKPMKDWEAVWRNWMRRAAKEHARNAGNGHSRSQNQLAANMAGWDAWVADEEAREERKAIGSEDREVRYQDYEVVDGQVITKHVVHPARIWWAGPGGYWRVVEVTDALREANQ